MKKARYVPFVGMALLLSLAIMVFSAQSALAEFPERPITAIVAFPPGESVGLPFVPLATYASPILGQPISVEYHAGGSGGVGMGMVKKSKPDGYTLGVTASQTLINQHLNKVSYDMIKDFTPIVQFVEGYTVMVVQASSPWKTLKELIDYAKANPGKIRYASSGPGSPAALGMQQLGKQYNIDWVHVPFDGGPEALTAILGGHVEVYSSDMSAKPHIASGRLRGLLVFGAPERMPAPLDIPTDKELGLSIATSITFRAIFGPKGIPPKTLETLEQAFKKGVENPEYAKTVLAIGMTPRYRSSQEFSTHLLRFNDDVAKVIREGNIK